MKNYNFELANRIINKLHSLGELEEAEMGMKEDWFWTGQPVWNKEEGFVLNLNKETLIGGIKGSYWATPIIRLTLSDGTMKDFECCDGEHKISDIEKIEKQMMCVSGCLSVPCQSYSDSIELEKFND